MLNINENIKNTTDDNIEILYKTDKDGTAMGIEDTRIKASFRIRLFQHDTRYDWFMTGGMWLVSAFWAILLALGMPTGIGAGFDVMVVILAHTLGSIIFPLLIAIPLTYVPLPVPKYLTGYMFYAAAVVFYVMDESVNYDLAGSVVMTSLSLMVGAAGGWLIGLVTDRTLRARTRGLILLVACLLIVVIGFRPHEWLAQVWSGEEETSLRSRQVVTLASQGIENPALEGNYTVQTFTYGSGRDKHRPEYGQEADVITQTVDASSFIHKWPAWRKIFWGFDATELPLNGRVWMPAEEGTYPLVLIVHGNHTMEHFSDAGYAYIGELLASRGMIAISIDQNFINFSHWSGIPNDNYKLRTWVLLHHIKEVGRLNEEPGNPLYGKVDMHQIALIGHSRGGQAAAMAVDARRWFPGDRSLPKTSTYKIQAVIAITPTDVQVDKMEASLQDVYYLVIYAGKDADVSTLKGDEQYSRVKLNDPNKFKAALFVENGNHSYFNSSWGPADLALPAGWLLNQRETMSREEQERVAKLYVSAMLEIVFHERREYIAMFRNHEVAGEWLSEESRYANRFMNGAFRHLADFERTNGTEVARYGSILTAEGFEVFEVDQVRDQNGGYKGTKGAILEWNDEAKLKIDISEEYRYRVLGVSLNDPILRFSYMNAIHDLERDDSSAGETPEIIIELESKEGKTFAIPLSELTDPRPMNETRYTIVPWLESRLRNGKFRNKRAPVFQTVEIPFSMIEEETGSFEAGRLKSITFHFQDGPARVILDDIGFYDARFVR